MNRVLKSIFIGLTVALLYQFPVFADGQPETGCYDPDSLESVTVSGTVIVDSTMMYPMYYLDENGDNQADYHLNFGPVWYHPDSSLATRPKDGEETTISGGLYISNGDSIRIIVGCGPHTFLR